MASTVVFVFAFNVNLTALAFAVLAEQLKSTVKLVTNSEEKYASCVYDFDIVTVFALGAFAFVIVSQNLMMVAIYFNIDNFLGRRASTLLVNILHLTSWVSFMIAEVCLVTGLVPRVIFAIRYRSYQSLIVSGPSMCHTLRKELFGAGAAFIAFTGILHVFCYVAHSRAKEAAPLPTATATRNPPLA